MTKKTRAKARRALLTLSLVLVVAFAAVGGTIAWLTAETESVTNTFAPAGVVIDLTETLNPDGTTTDNENDIADWNVQLIPGETYSKNPTVSVVRTEGDVQGTDVDIYLFVKFEETEGAQNYLTYTSTLTETNGWYKLESEEDVWYREVLATEENLTWNLLQGNSVTVKDLTNETMATEEIELKYTAYAIQSAGSDDAEDAWDKLFAE